MSLTFSEYEQQAGTTAMYPDRGNNLYYPALGLGEVGEVQGKIKKIMRDSGGVASPEIKQAIAAELGDVLWYVAALAFELGIPMAEIAQNNLQKRADRAQRGVIKGSGDNR